MIAAPLVLALNPSIDQELSVDALLPEEKNPVLFERRWAGGKGINVARWLQFFGSNPTLLIPTGGATGKEIQAQLFLEKISFLACPIGKPTRTNLIITTRNGTQFRLNPPGPKLSRLEWKILFDRFEKCLALDSMVILSGSLPAQAPPETYARLIRSAHRRGAKVILDCDGAALQLGVKEQPFLVKPNLMELEQWARKPLRNRKKVFQAARAMARTTGQWVLVSQGKAGACLLSHQGEGWFASAPKTRVINSVGAGDALVAAVASQILKKARPEEWLRIGIAAGSAATTFPAGEVPPLAAVARFARQIKIKALFQ